jgi:hypothetical protein
MLFKWTGSFKKSEMLRNCDEANINRLVLIMTCFSYIYIYISLDNSFKEFAMQN